MTKSQIVNYARAGQLTDQMVAELFALPKEDVADALKDLTKVSVPDKFWFGLNKSMAKVIHEMNNPQAMEYFVEFFICNRKDSPLSFLENEELKWLLEEVEFEKAWNALRLYLSHVDIPFDQQKLVYESPHCSLFEAMIENQEIGYELEMRLVTDLQKDCSADERAAQLIRLKAYIAKYRLYDDAEVAMVRDKALADIAQDYAWRWGFCDRVMSGLLWELKRRIG